MFGFVERLITYCNVIEFDDWTFLCLLNLFCMNMLRVCSHSFSFLNTLCVEGNLFAFFPVSLDRSNSRYYYRNKVTNNIQWEYPELDSKADVEAAEPAADNSDESMSQARERGSDEHHRSRSSGSSRHRRKDDKEKSK